VADSETVALDLTSPKADARLGAGRSGASTFADLGEAVMCCPECAEREFGDITPETRRHG
jgi:hypothetical protein